MQKQKKFPKKLFKNFSFEDAFIPLSFASLHPLRGLRPAASVKAIHPTPIFWP